MIHQPIYQKLQEVARAQDTTTYATIAPLANLNMDNPADRNTIADILDDINRMEHQEGRPLLSAVVLLKEHNIPGDGFFTIARNLGAYTGTDDLKFWLTELRRVHDYWSNRA